MAVVKGSSSSGKATHNSKPTSKLSKTEYLTKPENRHGTSHKYSVAGAQSKLKGEF